MSFVLADSGSAVGSRVVAIALSSSVGVRGLGVDAAVGNDVLHE